MNKALLMSTLSLLAAFSPQAAMGLSPAPQAPELTPAQESLVNELKATAKQLIPAIQAERILRKDDTHLMTSTNDPNLITRVNAFNKCMDAFLDAIALKYPEVKREELAAAVLKTNFGSIATGGEMPPPNQEAQRWMIRSTQAEVSLDELGNEKAEGVIALPLSIYYAAKDASGKRIELFKTVELDPASRLGWVKAEDLLKWEHNTVFQLNRPTQRQIEIAGGPSFTPNPLFYEDSSSAMGGALGAVGLFQRMENGEEAEVQKELYNYQQATGAVPGLEGDREAAAEFEAKYGVKYTLSADTYRDGNIFFPIIGVGERADGKDDAGETYTGSRGESLLPYQVMFLSMNDGGGEAPQPEPQAKEILTEIYIVMDLSGSMEPYIEGLKAAINEAFGGLDTYKANFRLGFVGYRDDPTQKINGKELVALRFHGRTDGNEDSAFYDYTHAGMLSPDDFIALLEREVKSPRQEMTSQGMSSKELRRQLNLLQQEDTPEQLYQALNCVLRNNGNWTYSEDKEVYRFVVVLGDAPDKSATADDKGLGTAKLMLKDASESTTNLNISSIYLYNTAIKKHTELRETGKEQFSALSTEPGKGISFSVESKGSELAINDGISPKDIFVNALMGIVNGTRSRLDGASASQIAAAQAPEEEADSASENARALKELMKQSQYLFNNAAFSERDNKVLNKSLESHPLADQQDAAREYWVTEFDPLPITQRIKDPVKSKVFEPYVLMTPYQLNEWCRIAMTIVQQIESNGATDSSKISQNMAALFGLAAGNFEGSGDALNQQVLEALPYRSSFLEDYLTRGTNFGSEEEANAFAIDFKDFAAKLAVLQDRKNSLEKDAEIKAVIVNPTDPESTTTVPKDKWLYRIPLYLLP